MFLAMGILHREGREGSGARLRSISKMSRGGKCQ